ncbi:GntR family transcriptional regulator [Paenalkalicoccus suaedae]|uniref:GntR family transcriptional regulator n=1 Tax=Paenalkalicoccus suaedae TaxID=2592382 RepID=A0A859FCA4_9BACI|nr:GntR family transcriptional regulator [Paenalkalicoccus suaedae]QKS69856.1 GntR family transcriptional regulator [Paenalkalicoccus suaedae]
MLKYQQIALDIERMIETEQLKRGVKLPVLEALMKEFEVSKSTITKALDLLEKKGVIYQVRGSGIFVRGHKRKGFLSLISNQGFKDSLEEFDITSEVLELKIVQPERYVRDALDLPEGAEAHYVKRIRYINGKTLCVENSYYSKELIPYLNKEIVTGSIFHYITEGLKLQIGFSDMYLQVGKLTEEEAGYLQLKSGDPKLSAETIFHLNNGKPFDYSMITYNYEQSQFYVQSGSYLR